MIKTQDLFFLQKLNNKVKKASDKASDKNLFAPEIKTRVLVKKYMGPVFGETRLKKGSNSHYILQEFLLQNVKFLLIFNPMNFHQYHFFSGFLPC